MLNDLELNRIFSWLPYRESWPIDRNIINDNISGHYGELVNSFIHNPFFETYYSEDGNMGNYLEFICFPKTSGDYDGNAIIVCVSLCAPLAAYGQTSFSKRVGFMGWGGLFGADNTGEVSDASLKAIENEIISLLMHNELQLLEKGVACRRLPDEAIEAMKDDNLNFGSQYLHGIFQKTD